MSCPRLEVRLGTQQGQDCVANEQSIGANFGRGELEAAA
jgi:hypothetical protein